MAKNIQSAGLVSSSQQGIHARLGETLKRHLDNDWAQPLHQPTVAAYALLKSECGFSAGQPFVLDSGCGTGASTRQLASMFPGHVVIGVDQSLARLEKSGLRNGYLRRNNLILLRAELSTFWRLLAADGLVPYRHYLLYPNPWPKPAHLKRRWHGHPVFPVLLTLGGEIEMRCNWEVYAQEFALAVSVATKWPQEVMPFQPSGGHASAISPFERKYFQRGQSLFAVTIPASVTAAFRDLRLQG
jgi:tRNA G46 methylase TrmB